MLGITDLLLLPYTPDLTEAGIAYACRTLALSRPGRAEPSIHRLQRSMAGVAVELAFRRYLQGQSIRFGVASVTPFTDPDGYDVSLGGHRCELVSYYISHPGQVSTLIRDPSLLLQAPALIPSDDFAAEHHRLDDLLLFAFMLGSDSAVNEEDSSSCWIHLLPKTWSRPIHWRLLRNLTVKSESAASFTVELDGLNGDHEFQTARLEVSPQKPLLVEDAFYSLAYLCTVDCPQERLELRTPGVTGTYLISSTGWDNLSISGVEIILAGWLRFYPSVHIPSSLIGRGSRTWPSHSAGWSHFPHYWKKGNPGTPSFSS